METATLAGGCFWCTEAVFQRLRGLFSVTSGYTGGSTPDPTYEEVSADNTGHAEAIQIQFDPNIVSYEDLLEVFFKLHDPTTLNRQGNDVGSQYRSAIFYHSEKQKNIAERIKSEIDESKIHKDKVVTEITPFSKFYKAEDYHKNYYNQNRGAIYCKLVIDPKIEKLTKEFNEKLTTAGN